MMVISHFSCKVNNFLSFHLTEIVNILINIRSEMSHAVELIRFTMVYYEGNLNLLVKFTHNSVHWGSRTLKYMVLTSTTVVGEIPTA